MKQFFFLFIILCSTIHLLANNFNEKQKAIIYNEAIKTIQNYQTLSNLMADAVFDIDELNKTNQHIIDLFINRKANIYNDLDPNHLLSEMYELETYMNNLQLWYPDGLKISFDFDNLRAGNIIAHGNDIYTVDLLIAKKNNGNYLNRQLNDQTESIIYRIAFYQKKNSFDNFKIAGSRNSNSNTKNDNSKLLASVKSVSFSEQEVNLVKANFKALLNDYVSYLNLLTDPNELEEDKAYYKISFIELFKDTTIKVANDIEPNPENRWIDIQKYQQNIVSMYSDGIRNLGLNIDSIEYSDIIAENNNHFYIRGFTNKFFSGKFQNKTIHRISEKYDIKISFEKDENTFKNFKIASIDKYGVNLYGQDTKNIEQQLPELKVGTITRKGLYLGASIGGGISQYKNPNLTNDPILTWNIKNKSALNIDAFATWYLTSRIGITSGIGFNNYNALLQLHGNFQSKEFFTDINDQTYLKNIDAAYDSLISYSYMSLPLKLIIHSNVSPEKWGMFCEIGLINSFLINSKYNASGSIASSGYYPQFSEGSQINDDERWGFITRSSISEQGKATATTFNVALTTSIGISYPYNYFTSLFVGIEAYWGLNNLASNTMFVDAFGNQTQAEKISLSKYSLKFGINYKF